MTQHELADETDIPQSSIAAYESGSRAPSEDACRRILTAAGVLPSTLLRDRREQLVEHLCERGVSDISVFGSVARRTDDAGSDIDLLVTLPAGTTLLDVANMVEQAEHIVGTDVDLISRASLQPEVFRLHRVLLDEAVPV